jgi:dienelactone hydrolase
VAYFVGIFSLWLIISAATALRPGRRGIFGAIAWPVGWAAGELPFQAILLQMGLLGLLWWWGWPRTHWLSVAVGAAALVVTTLNALLLVTLFYSRLIVRKSMMNNALPLVTGKPRDDAYGSWWRTALQIPYHARDIVITKNVSYAQHERNVLDVWRMTTTPSNAPVMIYFHGGSWVFGDKKDQGRPMLHEMVKRGWIVVTANYRLAPKDPWPAQIEDATRVLYWVKKNIATYGGDPSRVVVSGGSAGGHLASLVSLTTNDETWRPVDASGVTDWSVRGCVSYYGVLEMTGDEEYWHGRGKGLMYLLENRVVQKKYKENVALYEALSPRHRVREDSPPFLVIQGGNDTLVDVNVARGFVKHYESVAVAPIYYLEMPFAQHTFDLTASPRTSAVTRAVVAFSNSVVNY